VAQAPVGADFYQATNVLIDFAAQVTFRDVLPVDQLAYAVYLGLAQFIHPRRYHRVEFGFDHDFFGQLGPDAVNAAQGYMGPFTVRYVYSGYANHSCLLREQVKTC
jgi:hypothetical protein